MIIARSNQNIPRMLMSAELTPLRARRVSGEEKSNGNWAIDIPAELTTDSVPFTKYFRNFQELRFFSTRNLNGTGYYVLIDC